MVVSEDKKMNKITNKQTGAMLLEVLISILIFSFGLLGLVGLQAVSSQNSVNSQDRTTAANLANELVADMWLKNSSTPSKVSGEITAWQTRVTASNLPSAAGTATLSGGVTIIAIQWRPTSKKTAESDSKYETTVSID